jgi:hypothetical protein
MVAVAGGLAALLLLPRLWRKRHRPRHSLDL